MITVVIIYILWIIVLSVMEVTLNYIEIEISYYIIALILDLRLLRKYVGAELERNETPAFVKWRREKIFARWRHSHIAGLLLKWKWSPNWLWKLRGKITSRFAVSRMIYLNKIEAQLIKMIMSYIHIYIKLVFVICTNKSV